MGLLTGSLSFKIYKTAENLPDAYEEDFKAGIKKHKFRPIDAAGRETTTSGWINPVKPLEEISDLSEIMMDEYIVLGLRIDRKSLNKKLMKAHVERRLEQIKKEKSLKNITKDHKLAVEEEVRAKFLKETSPSTAIIEMAWNINTGRVYFGSHSKTRNEDFTDLFVETFGINLIACDTFYLGQESARKEGGESVGKLLSIKSVIFSPLGKKIIKGTDF